MSKDPDHNDDPEFEDTEELIAEEGSNNQLKNLRTKLKEVDKKAAEYLAGWQRAKADYLNLKREEESAKAELASFAKKPILYELIHLADVFDLAFANKEAWNDVPQNWRQGVEYIHKELLAILNRHGLESINPLGEHFDPRRHHSVGQLETNEKNEDNIVLEVTQKGYLLGEEILRPAQVKVGVLKA